MKTEKLKVVLGLHVLSLVGAQVYAQGRCVAEVNSHNVESGVVVLEVPRGERDVNLLVNELNHGVVEFKLNGVVVVRVAQVNEVSVHNGVLRVVVNKVEVVSLVNVPVGRVVPVNGKRVVPSVSKVNGTVSKVNGVAKVNGRVGQRSQKGRTMSEVS